MSHKCHAINCEVEVEPRLLMCLRHWRMVPRFLQKAVWKHYRPGQEIDKHPSEQYIIVQRAAVLAVWEIEQTKKETK